MKTTPARPGEARGAWRRLATGVLGGLALSACHASVQGDAKTGGDGSDEPIKDFDRPLEASPIKAEPVAENFKVEVYALLGARHDLNYAGPKQATCQCLAAHLDDRADNPAFQWALGAPHLEPTTEWVIAFSSNGVACDAPPQGTLGASYQGYSSEGNDVVVYVEALGEGRPMTSGAVIPRPLGNGSVFIESTGAIYGRPLDGRGKRCKLAAPASAKAATTKPADIVIK